VRAAILTAARASLEREAFRELSVDAIMEPTGLTRTAFYRYFDDLGALMAVLLAEATRPLLRAGSAVADAALQADEAGFRGMLVDLATVFEEHGVVLEAAVAASQYDDAIEQRVREMRKRFTELIAAGLIERAAATGTDIPLPAETARALNAMNESYLLESFGRSRRVSAEEAADALWPIWRQLIFRV
jgi:AcrR family transcriptional regulator